MEEINDPLRKRTSCQLMNKITLTSSSFINCPSLTSRTIQKYTLLVRLLGHQAPHLFRRDHSQVVGDLLTSATNLANGQGYNLVDQQPPQNI